MSDWTPTLAWMRQHAPAGRVIADSRRIRPGDIFLAFAGDTADGRDYIAHALSQGAAAIVYEAAPDWAAAAPWGMTPARAVEHLSAVAGELAAAYYGEPSAAMCVIAVTGTNGKTTCAWWSAQALGQLGRDAAFVGTLGAGRVQALEMTGYTTPDAVQLQTRLAALRNDGINALAIEASSHGLVQGRLAGMHIDVAVFTNLTRDHLDFHGDMAAYEAAKGALFQWPGLSGAVINLDDPAGERYWQAVRTLRPDLELIGYSCTGHPLARLHAASMIADGVGTRFELQFDGQRCSQFIAVLGDYNIANWLACLGALLALPLAVRPTWTQAIHALRDVRPPDGRVQAFGGQDAPLVVVDFAHTPDGLEKVLVAMRRVAQARGGQLISVFGCGGDRDRGKRPQMAAISSRLADITVLTSDNPRTEALPQILSDMQAGLTGKRVAWIEPDRRVAIRQAIARAQRHDVVVVAGKGHERTQEIAGVKHPFYDPDEVQAALSARAKEGAC